MKSTPIILNWSANFGKNSFCGNYSQLNFNYFLINYQGVMYDWIGKRFVSGSRKVQCSTFNKW